MFKTLLLVCALLGWAALPAAARPAPGAAPPEDAHGTAAGAHDASADHDAHATGRLLPIPPTRADIMAAVWVIIIFIVLLAILYPTAWRQVLAGLKKREERIRKDIADAEAARRRSEETLAQYNQQLAGAEQRVREMLAKATADGERLATTIRMQAQQEAEQIKERSSRDIAEARDAAMGELTRHAADLATSMAAKILRRNVNADDQRELIRSSLDELQTISK